jgi:hypothetical protein
MAAQRARPAKIALAAAATAVGLATLAATAALALLVLATSAALALLAASAAPSAAATLRVTDSARMSLVSADGNTLFERGRATGTLPGTVEVSLTLTGHAATSRFTIRTRGGTISGRGSGTLKPGKGGWDSFGGSVSVVRGTGRFRGASGRGGLYGAIYRITDAMSVQVAGTLRY